MAPIQLQVKEPLPPSVAGDPGKQFQRKRTIFRAYQLIWYIVGVIEVLLVFRFLLRLVGANPASGFTEFIYATSAPFAIPFRGILPVSTADGSVVEWSTLLAMLVYVVIAYGLVKLFQFAKPVTSEEVERTVDTEI